MIITTNSRNGNVSSIKSAERVQAVLDSYPENEFVSEGKRKSFEEKHGWRFHDFILMAVKYGMVVQVHKGKGSSADPSRYAKTFNYPEFRIVERAPTQKTYKPRKQGDGSVLKPKFNHAIAPPKVHVEAFRPERVTGSKMPTIAKNEDRGAYDVQARLERLRELRELKA